MRALLLAGVLAAGVPFGSAQAFPTYTVTDLGSLGAQSYGMSLNNSGQVAGYYVSNGQARAFRYSSGVMTDLGTLGGQYSYAYGINDNGVVIGTAATANSSTAFTSSGGALTSLGTLGGTFSYGYDINNSGQATGLAANNANQWHAYRVSGGLISDLGTLGGDVSSGQAINNGGQVAGYSIIAGNRATHAFLYSGSTMKDLGTLGGTSSYGYGLNDAGQVVGEAALSSGANHAFLYSNGVMSDLGTLGGAYSGARSINSSGQIVGTSNGAVDTGLLAFLYDAGSMVALNSLLSSTDALFGTLSLTEARGINDAGQIVANGCTTAGVCHGYLLTPEAVVAAVPEPASLALLGAGLIGAGVIRRRRSA